MAAEHKYGTCDWTSNKDRESRNGDGRVGGASSDGSGGGSETLPPSHEAALMNHARDIFKSAVNSVLPREMVTTHVVMDASGDVMTIQDKGYRLHGNVHVVGFGKAVLGMARAVDDLIGRHIVRGVVSVPQGTRQTFRNAGKIDMLLRPDSSIQVREGAADNMPDREAHGAALEIADLATSLGEGDLLLVLISGGGSALLPAPAPPITLSDMLSVTSQMSRGGATIGQLNTIRKQLDFLKGGGLARLAYPAKVVSLILSDIVGDPVDLIASAPTVADSSTPQDCLATFSQLNIASTIPKTVTEFLKEKSERIQKEGPNRPLHRETSLGEGPNRPLHGETSLGEGVSLSDVQNVIIGSNKMACDGACRESEALGYRPFVLSTGVEGEARHVGHMFAQLAVFIVGHLKLLDVGKTSGVDTDADMEGLRERVGEVGERLISSFGLSRDLLDGVVRHVETSKMASSGVCIVAGGETTVNVTGTGRGGRNQEMATSAGLELDKVFRQTFHPRSDGDKDRDWQSSPDTPCVVFLSAGTDGQDGPTPAAGGVVGLGFVESARQAGWDPVQYLDNNDSFSLLGQGGEGWGLVDTGLTGTNVMDIHVLLVKAT